MKKFKIERYPKLNGFYLIQWGANAFSIFPESSLPYYQELADRWWL